MRSFFAAVKEDESPEDLPIGPKVLCLKEAMGYVQKKMFEDGGSQREEKNKLIRDAMAGDAFARGKLENAVFRQLCEGNIEVEGFSNNAEAAEHIYSMIWGLGIVEKYYRDDEVDEIRVNGPDNIYIVKRGKSFKAPERFESEAAVEQVIKRMIIEDVGVALDRSSPRAESVRKDGSRLTATCYPVSKTWTFVLRKHDTFKITLDNLIRAKTLDEKTWKILNLLVKGRANILFSGNVGAGKTSMMRKLAGAIDPSLRVLVIGKDLELRLSEHYPEKDIIELEEHPYAGATMKALFETALRESPDCIIVEEFRGAGEAMEAIRACTRGHFGSMASAHFNNAEEAIEGTAMMMLEEGLNLPLNLAMLRVARAFNVVVQMYGDAVCGIKKVVEITEVYVDEGGTIRYIPPVKWVPYGESYMGEGEWEIKNNPSPKLISHIKRTVLPEEIVNAGFSERGEGEILARKKSSYGKSSFLQE